MNQRIKNWGLVVGATLFVCSLGCGDDTADPGADAAARDSASDTGAPDANMGDAGGADATGEDASGSDPFYVVSTCAFSGETGDCDPIALPDGAKMTFELSFALINPNTGPGCAGTLDLSLNGVGSGPGRMAWESHELDSESCMMVGQTIEGDRGLEPVFTEDVYHPIGDFTFRIRVEAQ